MAARWKPRAECRLKGRINSRPEESDGKYLFCRCMDIELRPQYMPPQDYGAWWNTIFSEVGPATFTAFDVEDTVRCVACIVSGGTWRACLPAETMTDRLNHSACDLLPCLNGRWQIINTGCVTTEDAVPLTIFASVLIALFFPLPAMQTGGVLREKEMTLMLRPAGLSMIAMAMRKFARKFH